MLILNQRLETELKYQLRINNAKRPHQSRTFWEREFNKTFDDIMQIWIWFFFRWNHTKNNGDTVIRNYNEIRRMQQIT